ncbi:hypothetical protein RhiLY_08603 [Ceratobasidium sp. AG-Ba]|nr:hypothetical protein RhiLY_08603 [Ceratobasidium sp. AG-Ba]
MSAGRLVPPLLEFEPLALQAPKTPPPTPARVGDGAVPHVSSALGTPDLRIRASPASNARYRTRRPRLQPQRRLLHPLKIRPVRPFAEMATPPPRATPMHPNTTVLGCPAAAHRPVGYTTEPLTTVRWSIDRPTPSSATRLPPTDRRGSTAEPVRPFAGLAAQHGLGLPPLPTERPGSTTQSVPTVRWRIGRPTPSSTTQLPSADRWVSTTRLVSTLCWRNGRPTRSSTTWPLLADRLGSTAEPVRPFAGLAAQHGLGLPPLPTERPGSTTQSVPTVRWRIGRPTPSSTTRLPSADRRVSTTRLVSTLCSRNSHPTRSSTTWPLLSDWRGSTTESFRPSAGSAAQHRLRLPDHCPSINRAALSSPALLFAGASAAQRCP